MKLYNLSLQPSTSIMKVIYGNFSAAKQQQILIVRTKCIELYNINENGKLQLLCLQELFCVVRTVVSFRIHGTSRDRLIIGSDSGKVVILEYVPEKHRFIKTHEQTFGKSGCRRAVPGHHIAVDPRGRAVMIAAIEKQKFVYVLAREQDKIIIQSPREAHKSHAICTDVVALDVGNENALFVCLEMNYGQVEDKEALINVGGVKKSIVYYEMDFGMNSVIRKKQIQVDATAHMLIPVPGGDEGPGGVLVLLEDFLIFRASENKDAQLLIRFPIRKNRPGDRKTQFTAYTTFRGKGFFFLIASQLGDLFKVQFKMKSNNKQVLSIKIEYFDTVSCLSSLALLRNGYIFCASEKQNHILYTWAQKKQNTEQRPYTFSQMQNGAIVQFNVITQQNSRCLVQTDRMEQFGPATDLAVTNFNQNKSLQIYMLNASGSGKSYLRVIKQGLKVIQKKKVKCPTPHAIWSIKGLDDDESMKLIILGLQNKIIVFAKQGDSYISAAEPGLDVAVTTIYIGRLRDNSLVQVTANGYRHITKNGIRPTKIDGTIIKAITRGGQVVIALQGGGIIYYELDINGDLIQVEQSSFDDEVVDMELTPIKKDRVRSDFLVVGLKSSSIKVLDLSDQSCLQVLSESKTKDLIESVAVQIMEFASEEDQQKYGKKLYAYVGLSKGIVMRTQIDSVTGHMKDLTAYILGEGPIKLTKMTVMGKPGILALSEKPWLIYAHGNKQIINPLSYNHLDMATSAKNQVEPHLLCCFYDKNLVFIILQNFGQMFHSDVVPLTYSGKKVIVADKTLAILQSQKVVSDVEDGVSKWRSLVSIYCPFQNKFISHIKMQENEVCTAIAYCTVRQKEGVKKYLVLSCSKSLTFYPKLASQKNKIKVFEDKDNKFEFYHETDIEDVSLTLHPWQQKFLAGVGNCMRAYQIGRKKVLRKAQLKNLSSPVNTIQSSGKRIFVTEVCDSFHMYTYKQKQQTFYDIADDILPRYVTTTCNLDAYTMIGADKFQNIFVSRVPRNAQDDFQNNPNTYKFQWEHGYLNGAPFKMQQICSYYVGEIVTSIQKAQMVSSGKQIIIYSTINGGINALCPFDSRQNVDFFTHLQMYLSKLLTSLSGRDHLSYRSYYTPCKGVIDGDLCEVFIKLPYNEQAAFAKDLDLTPQDIHRKLEEVRRYLI